MTNNNPSQIAQSLVAPHKGILAADESTGTMKKRLDTIAVESTLENRSMWREIMATAPGIESAISGVILFDETLRNPLPNGKKIADLLKEKNIFTGIKVDKGTVKYNGDRETFTLGLDGLSERLEEYKEMGAVFTKWRTVYIANDYLPSAATIIANSVSLAEYAYLVQKAGMVPIVEPEILVLQGSHGLERSREVTEIVLKDVFHYLKEFRVDLKSMLLKPNMVLPGKESSTQVTAEDIAKATVDVLKKTVPPEVPGIVFLSGGLTPDQSTQYLKTMNKTYSNLPWQVSYSYGRALQQEGLQAWGGKKENIHKSQEVFMARSLKISAARDGK